MAWRIFKYIQHLFYRKHRKGHGIHSPYVFEFVNRVVCNGEKTEVPERIRDIHRELRNSPDMIPDGERKIRSFVRGASVSRKFGALLYRIAKWMEPEMILELGTGLGISTLYLASGVEAAHGSGSDPAQVHTIEGNASRATFSEKLFKRYGLNAVKVHCGEVDGQLQGMKGEIPGRFLAFVDANHRHEPTVSYVQSLISMAGEEALIVMDDIYWSGGMNRAWKEIISRPDVRVSIDLFHMGILLLRKDLHKTHYKIKF
ncbi:MAG: class I SAM-dependent methyltransferase [Bacteroidota bacterium]